jgi:hypothetical protein
MLAVVVSTSSYLDFISYAVTLTSFHTIGLDRRRLSSCIVSWIWGGVWQRWLHCWQHYRQHWPRRLLEH